MLLFKETHIAPCGVNCGTCRAYLRSRNRCGGCRNKVEPGLKHSVSCSILNCIFLAKTDSRFCYACEKYPCRRMKDLEERYSTKYRVSLLGNLERIKQEGLGAFLKSEEAKWLCPGCGGTVCVHTGDCLQCKN